MNSAKSHVCDFVEFVFIFRVSAVKGSFGEMLLLIAIHFHSNQTHAVIELVSSSLGLKVSCSYEIIVTT